MSRATRPDKVTQDSRPGFTFLGLNGGTRGLILAPSPLPPIHVASDSAISHLKYCFRCGGMGRATTQGVAGESQGHLTPQPCERTHTQQGSAWLLPEDSLLCKHTHTLTHPHPPSLSLSLPASDRLNCFPGQRSGSCRHVLVTYGAALFEECYCHSGSSEVIWEM